MRYGTSNFRSHADARTYYRKQGENAPNIHVKISEGLITIGAPALKPGQSFRWDADGRGEITENEPHRLIFDQDVTIKVTAKHLPNVIVALAAAIAHAGNGYTRLIGEAAEAARNEQPEVCDLLNERLELYRKDREALGVLYGQLTQALKHN
jgi:hypothetical protein